MSFYSRAISGWNFIMVIHQEESVCGLCCYIWGKDVSYWIITLWVSVHCQSFVWLLWDALYSLAEAARAGRAGWKSSRFSLIQHFNPPCPTPTSSHPANAFHLHRANRPGSLNCTQQAANVKKTGESHREGPLKRTEAPVVVNFYFRLFYFKLLAAGPDFYSWHKNASLLNVHRTARVYLWYVWICWIAASCYLMLVVILITGLRWAGICPLSRWLHAYGV